MQLPLIAGATSSHKRLQALNGHDPSAAQSSSFCRGHQRSRWQAAQTMHSLREDIAVSAASDHGALRRSSGDVQRTEAGADELVRQTGL